MGLLDDAIRDHLDLKRRHGADPVEVERAEREALGPVRRKGDVAAGYADADEPLPDDADAPVASRPVAYDQAEDDWDYPDDRVAVDDPSRTDAPFDDSDFDDPEPPRSSRRTRRAAEADEADQPDQPRGLAARFGLRGRRTEEEPDADLEPESDEPLAEDEPTRVHRATGSGRASAPTGGETSEHDVDDALHHEREGGDPDEDMLEETPEFLQDTPDHDRLWFEQKPPRDFDFDG